MGDVVRVGTVEAGPGQKQFGYLAARRAPDYEVRMPVGIITAAGPVPGS